MSEQTAIHVNFGRPMPLFPLETAALLPQQILPLHIFEPRYRQMVEHVLDGSGQFAMAVYEGARWKQEYHGRPPIRAAVCIGHIVQHEKLPDGKYNLLVQGVCRATIDRELPPDSERLYRAAMLRPVSLDASEDEKELPGVRERLSELLADGPLAELRASKWITSRDLSQVPTAVLLELVSFAMLTDRAVRYSLLAEGRAERRAQIVERELERLERLVTAAALQRPSDWPKGCSWN